jgi:hypothetical protein
VDGMPFSKLSIRASQVVVLVLLGAYALVMLAAVVRHWDLGDMRAYLGAAERLMAGQTLYPAGAQPDASETYRYAPWFAAAWVPATFVPEPVVAFVWSVLLIAALVYVAVRLLAARSPVGVAASLVFVPLLAMTAAYGNVQPLLIAGLMHAPKAWSIGLAASLKVSPILLMFGVGRRQAVLAIVIAVILWAPVLLFDLSAYPTDPGVALIGGPLWLHAVAALALVVATFVVPIRYRLLVAALATVVAIPRLHLYDFTFVLAAVPQSGPALWRLLRRSRW